MNRPCFAFGFLYAAQISRAASSRVQPSVARRRLRRQRDLARGGEIPFGVAVVDRRLQRAEFLPHRAGRAVPLALVASADRAADIGNR